MIGEALTTKKLLQQIHFEWPVWLDGAEVSPFALQSALLRIDLDRMVEQRTVYGGADGSHDIADAMLLTVPASLWVSFGANSAIFHLGQVVHLKDGYRNVEKRRVTVSIDRERRQHHVDTG